MKFRSLKNPILPDTGACDPHIRIYDGKVWLYATHDALPNGNDFEMYDWQVWSSPDMIEWTLETTIRPEDTWMGKSRECWAPDAAERNGKYFFYFSNCVHDTGVLVGDTPAGPFKDVLGKPLLPRGLTPTKSYDPAVFIDDDPAKTPYIIFGVPDWAGGDGYYIARLNEDMVSLAEKPRKVQHNHLGDDKPYLHKHNGLYYLSWASFYAVSESVYGPYTFVGNTGTAHDHGCFFEWNNQWFHAYGVFDPTATFRSTAITYLHYRGNGEMVEDPLIAEYGVGQYDAGWNRIEAQWYMAAHGLQKEENARGNFELSHISDGAWACYPNVHNLKANARICLFGICTGEEGCTIEIHQGNATGKLLGRCSLGTSNIKNPADWRGYSPAFIDLNNEAGSVDLCLVFRGKGDSIYRLDWWRMV